MEFWGDPDNSKKKKKGLNIKQDRRNTDIYNVAAFFNSLYLIRVGRCGAGGSGGGGAGLRWVGSRALTDGFHIFTCMELGWGAIYDSGIYVLGTTSNKTQTPRMYISALRPTVHVHVSPCSLLGSFITHPMVQNYDI